MVQLKKNLWVMGLAAMLLAPASQAGNVNRHREQAKGKTNPLEMVPPHSELRTGGFGHPRTAVDLYLGDRLGIDARTYSLTLAMEDEIRLSNGGEDPSREYIEKYLLSRFSEASEDVIIQIIKTLGRENYNNSAAIGKPGVGKSFLIRQLVAILSFGVLPESLKAKLGISNAGLPESGPFAQFFKAFIGNPQVIKVDATLLTRDNTEPGEAMKSAPARMISVLGEIFDASITDFRNNGKRTLFILEEVASSLTKEDQILVQGELKRLLDKTGFKNPNDPNSAILDSGIESVVITTTGEWRKLIAGDGAIERRFERVDVVEQSEAENFKILKKYVTEQLTPKWGGIEISDDALWFLIHNRRQLALRQEAMPGSILKGAEDLILSMIGNPRLEGSQAHVIGIPEAQHFLQKKSGLTDIWFTGPNGEPPFTHFAERLKERVIGQDAIIDDIAETFTTYARLGFPQGAPVFILGGPPGSGKTTLVEAINQVLYGNSGGHVRVNVSAMTPKEFKEWFEGRPPDGGFDGSEPLILNALETHGRAVITLDEATEMDPANFRLLNKIAEEGVIRSANDPREAFIPPIFILGHWGDGKTAEEVARLTPVEFQKLFSTTVPVDFLERAERLGGLKIFENVNEDLYGKIVNINAKEVTHKFKIRNGIDLTVTPALIDQVSSLAKARGQGPRGLERIFYDLVANAISRAMSTSLSQYGAKIEVDFDGKSVVVRSGEKTWLTPLEELLSSQAKGAVCDQILKPAQPGPGL